MFYLKSILREFLNFKTFIHISGLFLVCHNYFNQFSMLGSIQKSDNGIFLLLILYFRLLVHARSIYMFLTVTYYENIPEETWNRHPDLNPLEMAMKEVENHDNQVREFYEAAEQVWHFFIPCLAREPGWNFHPGKKIQKESLFKTGLSINYFFIHLATSSQYC